MEFIRVTKENLAKERNVPFEVIHLESAEQAQNFYSPFSTFSLYYNGEFVTHEILSEKKFDKLLTEKNYGKGSM